MAIRMQPKDIEVPVDDPFKHDLLGRKEPAEILTHLLGSIEGPCVLAVDATWGDGKSTFLRLWSQHLRNHKVPVIQVNAWETDHSNDPFAMLNTELASQLSGQLKDKKGKKILANLWEATKKVSAQITPGLLQLTFRGVTGQELPSSIKK